MASVRRNLDRNIARTREVRTQVRAVADELLDAARARAAAHTDTGTFADSLKVERGRVDAEVVSDDPQALSKEFGHTDAKTGRHVAGIHALGGAAADLAARR